MQVAFLEFLRSSLILSTWRRGDTARELFGDRGWSIRDLAEEEDTIEVAERDEQTATRGRDGDLWWNRMGGEDTNIKDVRSREEDQSGDRERRTELVGLGREDAEYGMAPPP
ncbi:hypothetical protein MLD38_013971 [Melastoma candidum]|uniref:Uncharacterized protein n=1 Tax=Melastoma candidum TaxID=119954 RepID=A0ACB9RD52_9MYRT|nr:hypothetical protein MLD38_013971 [Melastoma candidum]